MKKTLLDFSIDNKRSDYIEYDEEISNSLIKFARNAEKTEKNTGIILDVLFAKNLVS